MYWFEYDAKAAKRAMLEEMQEEREEGRTEGRAEERLEMVKKLLKVGASLDIIKKATGWSEEKLLEIANSD